MQIGISSMASSTMVLLSMFYLYNGFGFNHLLSRLTDSPKYRVGNPTKSISPKYECHRAEGEQSKIYQHVNPTCNPTIMTRTP
jgi:hypothetical protein